MMIKHLIGDLRRSVPQWDMPSKISLASGLVLLPILLIVGFAGPDQARIPARIGAFGILLTLQLVILWANRKSMSPYHAAQEHFISGDYVAAREILEQIPYKDAPSVDALVLLGNTYRHLGQFDASQQAIDHALSLKPDYHYALYGLGKLCLVMGQYEDASNYILQALEHGAPNIVQFDLAQAYYLTGDIEQATHYLRLVLPMIQDEPAQALLVAHYLHQLGQGDEPSVQMIRETLSYWRDEAQKYGDTSYGKSLQTDVDTLMSKL